MLKRPHRSCEEDQCRDGDVEGAGEEKRPAPCDEVRVVLCEAVVDLRDDELDSATACNLAKPRHCNTYDQDIPTCEDTMTLRRPQHGMD